MTTALSLIIRSQFANEYYYKYTSFQQLQRLQQYKTLAENVLCAVKCGDVVQVVRIEKKVVHDLKLCRFQEHRALIVSKSPVLVDSITGVSLVY